MIDAFVTYIQAEKRYSALTVRNYRHDIESFVSWCASNAEQNSQEFDLTKVTTEDIREWITFRMESGEIKAASMNRELSSLRSFYKYLRSKGVEPELTYLFMHGHTLMDNVVMVILGDVCEKLRQMSIAKIVASSKEGVALKNEMSNYKNTLRSIRDVLLDNENYTSCPLYKLLKADIQAYIDCTIAKLF